ncbi:MAG: phytanoyl-CoA dioxygenase family protein [Alphaproteobacteria bacterium]
MAGSLDATLLERFRREGVLFPLRALSAADALARAAQLGAFADELGAPLTRLLRFKAHLRFRMLEEVARHPAILDAVEAIIGPDVLVFTSTVWAKAPGDRHYVSWHQDSAYFGLEPHAEVTAWIALSDSRRDNGCLHVVPGSHLAADFAHAETFHPDNLLIRGQTIAGIRDEAAVDVELEPGEFSLHHERMVHGSQLNASARPRIGYAVFYIPTHVRSTLGRRTALLVRGRDGYGNWDPDPTPAGDNDPMIAEFMKLSFERYRDQEASQALEPPA